MILPNLKSDSIAVGIEGKSVGISTSKTEKLKYLFSTGIYQDGYGSVVRELSSNMIDAYRACGKNIMQDPAIIKLEEDSISFIDKGIGMSPEVFDNVYCNMLESTSELREDAIGSFGVGSKSPWAIVNQFYVTTVYNGNRRVYILNKEAGNDKVYPISEGFTEEPNGTTVTLPLTGTQAWSFEKALRQQAALFKGIWFESSYFNLKDLNEDPIIEGKSFYYRRFIGDGVYVALDEVLYKLNPNDLGFPVNKFPFIPKLYVSEGVVPTLSREQLILNEHTKNLIKNRFALVLYELEDYRVKYDYLYEYLWNSEHENFNLSDTVSLIYKGTFYRQIYEWCGLTFSTPLNFEVPQGYAYNRFDFFNAFETVISINNGRIGPNVRVYNPKFMQYSELPRGMKEFLREEYDGYTLLKKPNLKMIKFTNYTRHQYATKSIFYHLKLTNLPKNEWRPLIEWYVKELENYWNSLSHLPLKEFEEWKARRVKERVEKTKDRKKRVSKEQLEYGYYSHRKRIKIPLLADDASKIHPYTLKVYSTDESKSLDRWHNMFENFKFIYIPEKKVHLIEGLPNWIEISDFKKSRWFTEEVTKYYWDTQRISGTYPNFITKKVKDLLYIKTDYNKRYFFANFFYQPEYFYKPLHDYYSALNQILKNYNELTNLKGKEIYLLQKQNQRFKRILNL